MHLLFLDESGEPSKPMFAIGGVAVRADEWEVLRQRWRTMLEEQGWPSDKELKWHGCLTGEVPPAVADAAFASVAEAPITCFVCVLRPLAGRETYPQLFAGDDDTYATALTFLAERFQRFLAAEGSHGVIVLDSRRRELDDRLRRFFERLHEQGSEYTQLERIVDSLMFGPSHHSLGLQVADLVVGTTLKAQRAPGDASRWFKQLRPRFASHPASGEIEGVGLKVFPPKERGETPPPAKLFDLQTRG
jgi:hypothetical protein